MDYSQFYLKQNKKKDILLIYFNQMNVLFFMHINQKQILMRCIMKKVLLINLFYF
jgi:hypothetical protein